jgi:voltage-gated potassium channel
VAERNHAYLLFMLSLSLFALGAMALDVSGVLSPAANKIVQYADTFICALFFLDFLYLFWCAPNRAKYLLTWGVLDLASSIPVFPNASVFRYLWLSRAARVMRIFRVLRCVRSARILVRLVVEKRIQSTALAAVLLVTVFITVSAISVLHFEAGHSNSNICSAEDAIWWSAYTMMTASYRDKFPVSTEGSALGAVLAFLGLGLLGTFSGFVASRFLGTGDADATAKLDEVKRDLAAIKELLRSEFSERDKPLAPPHE